MNYDLMVFDHVMKGEVLSAIEAAELFDLFMAGKRFPKKYTLREKNT